MEVDVVGFALFEHERLNAEASAVGLALREQCQRFIGICTTVDNDIVSAGVIGIVTIGNLFIGQ